MQTKDDRQFRKSVAFNLFLPTATKPSGAYGLFMADYFWVSNSASPTALLRSGKWNSGFNSGRYSVNAANLLTYSGADASARCALVAPGGN